jgi:hypothetical protein
VSIRINPRTMIVQKAHAAVEMAMFEACRPYDITQIELIGILLSITQQAHKYALREERHGDTDKRADEA